MDRSRREGARMAPSVTALRFAPSPTAPRASQLTIRPQNRRRPPTGAPPSLWERLSPTVADACGRALRRSLPVLAATAALGAVSGTAWGGYRFVTHSARFAIEQIELRGNHHLSDAELLAALPIHIGDNVFDCGLDAAMAALHANPWIDRAAAHRVLPHTVVIELREREAVAVVELGERYLVDAFGQPFKRAADGEAAGLPAVTGLDRASYLADPQVAATQVVDALHALAMWRGAPSPSDARATDGADVATAERGASERPRVTHIHIDARGGLTLGSDELSIDLGPGDGLAARLRTFDAAWSELSADERARARAIHLDPRTDRVTIAFSQKDPSSPHGQAQDL